REKRCSLYQTPKDQEKIEKLVKLIEKRKCQFTRDFLPLFPHQPEKEVARRPPGSSFWGQFLQIPQSRLLRNLLPQRQH
ncbi:MAG: hypothetical protein AAF998_26340, partial [Bacteroidota bacterium]